MSIFQDYVGLRLSLFVLEFGARNYPVVYSMRILLMVVLRSASSKMTGSHYTWTIAQIHDWVFLVHGWSWLWVPSHSIWYLGWCLNIVHIRYLLRSWVEYSNYTSTRCLVIRVNRLTIIKVLGLKLIWFSRDVAISKCIQVLQIITEYSIVRRWELRIRLREQGDLWGLKFTFFLSNLIILINLILVSNMILFVEIQVVRD